MTRDKRYTIGATLLVLVVTFTLIAQLSAPSRLVPFSSVAKDAGGKKPAFKEISLEENGFQDIDLGTDGLERVLGKTTPEEEDGFT
jgi:alpha-1,4-N-acetylglucosaminyltransferase EXTL3